MIHGHCDKRAPPVPNFELLLSLTDNRRTSEHFAWNQKQDTSKPSVKGSRT